MTKDMDRIINCFEKITYEKMLNLLNKETVNQNELRQEIKFIYCSSNRRLS